MKYLIFCIATSIILLACKKQNSSNISVCYAPIQNSKWELRKSEGGIAGTINYLSGNGQTIEFWGTDSFKVVYPTSSISLKDSGTFTIGNAVNNGDFNLTKKYYRNSILMTDYDSVRFVNNQLVFLARNGWADEPTIYYDKL
ncbi:MAG: hypothetical protein ACOVO1_02610 [Chitinophagaceae bacterium]